MLQGLRVRHLHRLATCHIRNFSYLCAHRPAHKPLATAAHSAGGQMGSQGPLHVVSSTSEICVCACVCVCVVSELCWRVLTAFCWSGDTEIASDHHQAPEP